MASIKSHRFIKDDFSRDVWCLFGLPIDNLTLAGSCRLLEHKIRNDQKAVLSTVNINWLATSLYKPDFRSTIILSDVSVIDGVPLLWLAKSLGLPFNEVVPGSSLIQSLRDRSFGTDPVKIFFFGGDEGIGQKAADELNGRLNGLFPVGFLNPGFGPIESFLEEELIKKINDTDPDILLVSLGALKGQLWIAATKDRLNAKVISHLGATINFIAGSVKRAPLWMQKSGIEWLWRILEEPPLFKRYLIDGISICRLLVKKLILFLIYIYLRFDRVHSDLKQNKSPVHTEERGDTIIILPTDSCHFKNIQAIRECFYKIALAERDLIVDFKNVKFVDNRFLGLLLILLKHQKRNQKSIRIINVNKRVEKIFRLNLFDTSLESLKFPIWELLE